MILQACYEGRWMPVLRIPVNTIDGPMHNPRVDEMEDTHHLFQGWQRLAKEKGEEAIDWPSKRSFQRVSNQKPNAVRQKRTREKKEEEYLRKEVSVCLRCRPISWGKRRGSDSS